MNNSNATSLVVEEEMMDSNNRRNMTSTSASCRRPAPPLLITLVTLFSLLLVNKEVNATTTYGCMETVSGLSLGSGCTAQDVKFERVSGFTVADALAQTCNCNCGGNTGKVCAEWNAVAEGYAAANCDTTSDPVSCWSPDGTLFGVGMVFGACLGADDNVQIALTVDLLGELLPAETLHNNHGSRTHYAFLLTHNTTALSLSLSSRQSEI